MKPYFSRDGIVIYHGRAEDVLPTLADDFGVVCTDPPYPGYEKGWDVPDVSAILAPLATPVRIVFWPPLVPSPIGDPDVEHIWHKPNGNSSHHYERILIRGDVPRGCKVFRVAAILPNYVQYAHEAVDHPTQKPIRLVRDLLRRYGNGPILDPFMGSGTTLRAAMDLGRPAVGVDINEAYCEIAARRLDQMVLPMEAPA